MRHHSPTFEKALRRDVKQAVRRDLTLRKEYRRARKAFRNTHRTWARRFLMVFFLTIFVSGVSGHTHHVDSALMAINLYLLMTMLFSAQALVRLPFQSRDMAALRLLPVSDSTIFSWEWDKFVKRSFPFLANLFIACGAMGLVLHFTLMQWILIFILAPLAWAWTLALAALGAARFPRLPYGQMLATLFLLGFVAIVAHNFIGRTYLRLLDHAAPTLNVLVPTGWPLVLFHLALPGGPWTSALLILPIGLVLWTLKSFPSVLRERCAYHEPTIHQAPDLVPGEDVPQIRPAEVSSPHASRPLGVTAIEEGILSGQFLAREEWDQDWWERTLWQWFSGPEKTMAEFAFPRGLAMTRPWKRIAQHFLVTLLLGFSVGMLSPLLMLWIFGTGLFIVFSQALGQLLNTGTAFRPILNGGIGIPLHAPYPVSFHGLSRMFLKCSLVQLPVFTLLVAAVLVLAVQFTHLTWERSLLMGIKAGVVLFGVRLLALVISFSSATNDTSRFRLRTVFQAVLFVLFCLCYLPLAAAGVALPIEWISWPCCGATLLIAYAAYRSYGWFYHTARFDLMRPTP